MLAAIERGESSPTVATRWEDRHRVSLVLLLRFNRADPGSSGGETGRYRTGAVMTDSQQTGGRSR